MLPRKFQHMVEHQNVASALQARCKRVARTVASILQSGGVTHNALSRLNGAAGFEVRAIFARRALAAPKH